MRYSRLYTESSTELISIFKEKLGDSFVDKDTKGHFIVLLVQHLDWYTIYLVNTTSPTLCKVTQEKMIYIIDMLLLGIPFNKAWLLQET